MRVRVECKRCTAHFTPVSLSVRIEPYQASCPVCCGQEIYFHADEFEASLGSLTPA